MCWHIGVLENKLEKSSARERDLSSYLHIIASHPHVIYLGGNCVITSVETHPHRLLEHVTYYDKLDEITR